MPITGWAESKRALMTNPANAALNPEKTYTFSMINSVLMPAWRAATGLWPSK
jgi:hypothetical protein